MNDQELRKKSRSGAILTLIGVLMIVLVFVYLIYDLNEKNKKLTENIEVLMSQNEELNFMAKKLADNLTKSEEQIVSLSNTASTGQLSVAIAANDYDVYVSVLEKNPELKEDLAEAMKENLFKRKGYVQLIETNGNALFTKVDSPFEGDYMKTKVARAVRRGVMGDPDFKDSNRNGDVLIEDQIISVIKRYPSKSSKSVWAEIKY